MKGFKLLLLCVPLVACNAPPERNAPLRWAVVKRGEVYSAAQAKLRTERPYPAALANGEDDRQQRERLRQQVRELTQAAVRRCMAGSAPAARAAPETSAGINAQMLPAQFEATVRCQRATDGDQLIADLQSKLTALDGVEQQRRQFDLDTSKLAEQRVREVTEAYARSQGYQLVINGDSAVMYSESKAVVDVTAGVVEGLGR